MPIRDDGSGKIIYVEKTDLWDSDTTGVFAERDWAIADDYNVLKQIKFKIVPSTQTAGTLTLKATIAGDAEIDLTSLTATNSFSTIQTDLGTSPVATSPTDTLTLTSSDSSILITGNSLTDTIDIKAVTSLPTFTAGSVIFSNGTTLAEDNTNFFWDNSTDTLKIGGGTLITGSKQRLFAYLGTTDTTADINASITGVQDYVFTASSVKAAFGNYNLLRVNVSSGATLSGWAIGNSSIISRMDVSDQGTISIAAGYFSQLLAGNAAKVTTQYSAYVAGFHSVDNSGTITHMYDFLALPATLGATTVTNRYGIYLDVDSGYTKHSWISGNTLLGGTAYTTPTIPLVVQGGDVKFGTNFYWDNTNGRVGIGTTTPSTQVHIKSTADAAIYLEADTDNVSEDDNPYVKFTQDSGNVVTLIGQTGNAGFDPEANAYTGTLANSFLIGGRDIFGGIQFGTNTTVRATITNAGRLGLGTNAPGSFAHFVRGGTAITPNAVTVLNVQDSTSTSTSAGIGITSGNAATSFLLFGDTDSDIVGQIFYNNSTNLMGFTTNGTNWMTLLSTGELGIGTTAPDVKLHVLGTGTAVSNISASSHAAFQSTSTNGTNSSISVVSGNTGNASVFFGDPQNDNIGQITYDNNINSIALWTSNAARLTILSTGYTGIGVTSPTVWLSLAETFVVLNNPTADGYASSVAMSPTYTATTAKTVTRHNYLNMANPVLTGAGPAALTDACAIRFDAAAGTHKAVDSGTTKTTPGTVDAWVKVNISGTIYYVPAYTSKTS